MALFVYYRQLVFSVRARARFHVATVGGPPQTEKVATAPTRPLNVLFPVMKSILSVVPAPKRPPQ
jgi:hypothetical protein